MSWTADNSMLNLWFWSTNYLLNYLLNNTWIAPLILAKNIKKQIYILYSKAVYGISFLFYSHSQVGVTLRCLFSQHLGMWIYETTACRATFFEKKCLFSNSFVGVYIRVGKIGSLGSWGIILAKGQLAKGQLISEGLFKVFICAKKRTKIFLP